jgi:uncharacterized membrane protein YdjX (TVP38/TMEM64 family)
VTRSASTRRRRRFAGVRLALFAAALLAVVLVPFALWGDALDAAAPQWLHTPGARVVLAVIGIALLVVDVLLPIPSSVVAMGLCLSLGPLWGAAAVAAGCLLSFLLGYGLGRLLPEARLRAWIGAALWDRAREHAQDRALWWIVAARPLPVLAEISALLAGVFRVPPSRAFAHASAASLAVGALYGLSAWLGHREPGVAGLLVAMLAVPTLLWLAHRFVLRRLLRNSAAAPASVPPPRSAA